MMKVAIAGTNGLAQFLAYYLSQVTSHSFVFLTRAANPGLKERDWQVLVVTYENKTSLAYTLKGVDVVISTISGDAQIALVEAAATAQVRHFIPAAFSGPEQCSPLSIGQDQWQDLMAALDHHEVQSSMHYTLFTCGIFYERFGPSGLNGLQISTMNNLHGAIGEEGNFLVDLRAGTATIPVVPGDQEMVVCMTSARDVARYVIAALQAYEDLSAWPKEFKFCTERLTMSKLVDICSRVRGSPIVTTHTTHSSLLHAYNTAQQSNNPNKALAISQYLAVAEAQPSLNFPVTEINLPPDVLMFARTPGAEPAPSERFEAWLTAAWSTPTPPASASARASANTSGKHSGKSSRSGSSQKSKRPTPNSMN